MVKIVTISKAVGAAGSDASTAQCDRGADPGYNRRHDIPPGITGLAQVRYDTHPGDKLGHDLQYLVNWSPVRDLQILVTTVWVVLARRV